MRFILSLWDLVLDLADKVLDAGEMDLDVWMHASREVAVIPGLE